MKMRTFVNAYTPSPRGGIGVGVAIALLFLFASCSDEEETYDPYYNWQARNVQWFQSVTDSAQSAIREAQAQWGDDWDGHCQWRRYKSLLLAQDYDTHRADDSICVRILTSGAGTVSPAWSDSVRVSHRGWLMPTTYRLYNQAGQQVDSLRQQVFDQSYYGPFDPQTAAPALWPASGFVPGFATALQYMVEGDDWLVYVPARLAYGEAGRDAIPGHSTLVWRIHLAAVYPAGSGVPTWKVRRK